MIYQWKLPSLYDVPAQAAGEELERIYQERGKLEAADVVDESRSETAVLHPCFEWRDAVAAEKWREQQARGICNCIITVEERKDKEPMAVRAFFHTQGSYHPTPVIIQEADKYSALYQSALREFVAIREKFSMLSDREELRSIFLAIDAATAGNKKAPASAGNTDKGKAEQVSTTVSAVIISGVKGGCQA